MVSIERTARGDLAASREVASGDDAMAATVEKAARFLGRGFDMTSDQKLRHTKGAGGCMVVRSGAEKKGAAGGAKVAVPGLGVAADLAADVKCGKGDRIRFKSDVVEFNKMSELFNHRNALSGNKIPSGLFNSSFGLESSSWAEDAAATKCLAFDGYFISLLDLRLDCRPLSLADHVVNDVPAAWDPAAIARYIHGGPGIILSGLLPCTIRYRVPLLLHGDNDIVVPYSKFQGQRIRRHVLAMLCENQYAWWWKKAAAHVANIAPREYVESNPQDLDSFQPFQVFESMRG